MKIVVYGAGAVGAFFGGLLAKAGQDAYFVARGANLDALRTRGLRIDSSLLGDVTIGSLSVAPRAADLGPADLVLVCVKAHQTAGILDDLESVVGDGTVVVPLQNGVESDEELSVRFGRHRVATAVVYVGATLEEPGVVSHVAAGTITLGARPGFDAARLLAIRDLLATSGQPVRVSDDIQHDRWYKLLWNSGFNSLSALTGRSPQDLLAAPASRKLLRDVMQEVIRVGTADGGRLTQQDADDQIAWTEGTSDIRTSMMVDKQRGRQMETDALVGVVVRKGCAHSVPTPLTEVLFALLTAIDHTS